MIFQVNLLKFFLRIFQWILLAIRSKSSQNSRVNIYAWLYLKMDILSERILQHLNALTLFFLSTANKLYVNNWSVFCSFLHYEDAVQEKVKYRGSKVTIMWSWAVFQPFFVDNVYCAGRSFSTSTALFTSEMLDYSLLTASTEPTIHPFRFTSSAYSVNFT